MFRQNAGSRKPVRNAWGDEEMLKIVLSGCIAIGLAASVASGVAAANSKVAETDSAKEPATAENAGLRGQMEGREGKQRRQGARRLQQIHERLYEKERGLRRMRASVRGGELESGRIRCCCRQE
jgi:hypothetical protein